MLNKIIEWSLAHRMVVIVAWAVVAVAGVLAFLRLPLDAFPDTTPVQVQVNTTAPALSPLEIERQVSAPLEQAISGLPKLKEVRSISKFGLSQVTVIFEDGTDIYRSRQVVMERVQAVTLPAGIDKPQLGPVATGLGEVFHYFIRGKDKTLAELRTLHDWVVKPQMRAVPGVAEVNTWGGDERRIEIVVDPEELAKRGLSLDKVIEAVERNNANVGGGTLDRSGGSSLVQGVAIVTKPEDIGNIVITAKDGIPVRVADVARIVEGKEIRRGAVSADGRGEIILGLGFMLMGENSHDVTSRLKTRLEEVKKSLPQGVEVVTAYDRTSLVDKVLHTVEKNLFEGAILVIAVVFIFLGHFRAGLIIALAIPLSMLFAFDLMLRSGIAGSLMSLGAIDFGLIVDSSVIMVENSVRRLAEEEGDRSVIDVVREAAIEVRKPTMFGELIIMIVYLPILALQGVEGKLFQPMALTVIFALIGSMALSLTLMPVLATFVLKRGHKEKEPYLVRRLKDLYRPVLAFALGSRRTVLAIAGGCLAVACVLATQLGSEFVPRLLEGSIVVNTIRQAGVSLDESVRYGGLVEKALLEKFPNEIERLWSRTGSAEIATDPMGVELTDTFMTLKPRSEWKRAKTQTELVAAMEKELSVFPGMKMIFTQPIEMRVNEMIAGIRSDVGIKIFGDDLETLKKTAKDVEKVVKGVNGAADVSIEQVTGQSLVQVEVDREAVARYGIPANEVLEAVEALSGKNVGQMQEGDRRFPIAVRTPERYRTEPEALAGILVTSSNGERIPLSLLTKINASEGPSTINREWGKRRIVVQTNVRGRDVGSFVAEVQAAIDREVKLPNGYYVRYGGQFENLQRAQQRLMIVVPIALALIFTLLYFTYGRVLDAARVFTGVPFAAVGGIVALWLCGLPFSISAGVGFVALSGVSVLGDMVLVSAVRDLTAKGVPLLEAIQTAAEQRLRPVVMTALVASLGFVPMALNTGIGAEVQRPLAVVVIGGVVSSTLLTLLVLPVLYAVFGRGDDKLAAVSPGKGSAHESE